MLLTEIQDLLLKHQSLIVHFSGTPRGIGAGQVRPDFPADLQGVLKNSSTWEIPCSTVTAGHSRNGQHLMGSVGLIIRCQDGASLLGVCSSDAGSWYDPNTGRRNLGLCETPTITTCENSIVARQGHNEWIVRDYDCVGIFFDGTMSVWDSNTSFDRDTDFQEIGQAFPGLPVLYFCQGSLTQIQPAIEARNLQDFI